MDFPRLGQKDSPLGRNTFLGKEKVPGTAVNKEDQAYSVLEHERTHHYWFP